MMLITGGVLGWSGINGAVYVDESLNTKELVGKNSAKRHNGCAFMMFARFIRVQVEVSNGSCRPVPWHGMTRSMVPRLVGIA